MSAYVECPGCGFQLHRIPKMGMYHCYECDQDFSEGMFPSDGELTIEPGDNMTDLKRVTDDASKVSSPLFPYSLADIKYWIVKRRTGEIVRYTLTDTAQIAGAARSSAASSTAAYSGSLGQWCKHDLTSEPIFISGKTRLFICDSMGAKAAKDKVDFLIDGGDVISLAYARPNLRGILDGDDKLSAKLAEHNTASLDGSRVLKIEWMDRKAPLLEPGFWPALAKMVSGDVMTACQGGHGRSGTALVCLMMVLNPEYDASDAITHLRAMHCPRAIESYEQHNYIDEVATHLGRKANASDVHSISSFKEAFLKIQKKSALPYQDRLRKLMEKK